LQYAWQTSNGLVSTQKNPSLIFNNPGTYNVRMIARMNNGCADTMFKSNLIQVLPKLSANFQAAKNNFCKIPAVVNFTALNNDTNITSFEWHFGNDSIGFGKQVQHTYRSFGDFHVKLIVRNSLGCVDSLVIQNFIRIKEPKPLLTIDTIKGCAPRFVTARIIDLDIFPMTNWTWTYRDTVIASGTSLSQVIYVATPGSFVLKAAGTNPDGCVVEIVDTIIAGNKIIPTFTFDTNRVCFNPGIVKFINTTNATASILNKAIWNWDFGDGTFSSDSSPTHQFIAPGKFVVKLTASHLGCNSDSVFVSDSIEVVRPEARFSHQGLKCISDTVKFFDETLGANKWLWTISPGTTKNDSSFKHVFGTHGNFNIRLIAIDSVSGCRDTTNKSIVLYQKPRMGLSGLQPFLCPPYFRAMSDTSNYFGNPIIKKEWFIDQALMPRQDLSTLVQNNFNITLTESRYIDVKLVATDSLQCEHVFEKDSAFYTVKLTPHFNFSPDSGCTPLLIQAVDSTVSDFPIIKRFWEWGVSGARDTMNQTSISYTYINAPTNQTAGNYIILTAIDSIGCSNATTQRVFPSKPSGKFKTKTTKFCTYDSVYVEWDTDNTIGMSPFRYNWYIDDTLVLTQLKFSRNFFELQRTATIKLVVTDAKQCTDSSVAVVIIDNRQPNADFYSIPPSIKCPGPPIQLFDSSRVGASSIKKWLWSLGDGGIANIKNPSKVYLIPGEYDISLTVEDSLGCVSTEVKSKFVVIEGPWAETAITPKVGCLPLQVNFKATNKRVDKIEWDIGDGALYKDSLFNHTFTKAGSFVPLLIVTDKNGCKLAIPSTDTITVRPIPETMFSINKTRLCTSDVVQLLNETKHSTPIFSFTWSIGDSVFVNPQNMFNYRFIQGGFYPIKLLATDTFGCKKEFQLSDSVKVFDDIIPPVTPIINKATVLNNQVVLMDYERNQEEDFLHYVVYYNYIAGEPIDSTIEADQTQITFVQNNLQTLFNTYSYSIKTTDVCQNTSPASETHTTMNLEATGVLFANHLEWNHYSGWNKVNRYQIYRQKTGSSLYDLIAQVDGSINKYDDSSAVCYETSFYKIMAVKEGNDTIFSFSDTSGATPLYENRIPTPEHIRVTVVDNQRVLLQWIPQTFVYPLRLLLYRSTDSGSFELLTTLNQTDTFFIDVNVDVQKHTYAYTTVYEDNCGGVGPNANASRTILIKVDLALNSQMKYEPVLTWNPYLSWSQGVKNYSVFFNDETNDLYKEIGQTNALIQQFQHENVMADQRNYCYKVIANPNDINNIYSESNIACISTAPRLYVPNVFTVNGDGLNETFNISGIFILEYSLQVYNRYGEMIFESIDITNRWDGKHNQQDCSADVYFYTVRATGPKGQSIELKGNVTLLR